LRGRPFNDALDLVAVFLFDLRPHDLLGSLAEKLPILRAIVRHQNLQALEHAVDFLCQRGSVLETDLRGRPREGHYDPSAGLGAAARSPK
jgi:hypothetical protein